MTDLLVYWRDYRLNRMEPESGGGIRFWHSSSRLIGSLRPGDRMWLVSSGQTLGIEPRQHGFVVEVWTVTRVISNPGDTSEYPRERYARRVLARCDRDTRADGPINVDAIVRPAQSSRDAPIGRLLQGPRRLSPDVVEQLLTDFGTRSRLEARVVPEDPTTADQLNPELIALGIRQPWAELILRGHKSIEVRTVETNLRGPIYLYAANRLAEISAAKRAMEKFQITPKSLSLGRIVGSVEITGCRPCTRLDVDRACVPSGLLSGRFAWELACPQRVDPPVKPRFVPYGMWFYPFRRRNAH